MNFEVFEFQKSCCWWVRKYRHKIPTLKWVVYCVKFFNTKKGNPQVSIPWTSKRQKRGIRNFMISLYTTWLFCLWLCLVDLAKFTASILKFKRGLFLFSTHPYAWNISPEKILTGTEFSLKSSCNSNNKEAETWKVSTLS